MNDDGTPSAAQRPDEKHVWIVNHHAVLPSKDGGTARHLNLAIALPQSGWTATLIVASTRHSNGSQALSGVRLRNISVEDGIETLWVRTNAYGRRLSLRFLGMVVFAVNLLRPGTTAGLRRPDVVVGSTVHPLAAWAAYRLAKRHGVPFVYEIRDVWPESLAAVANISLRHPVSRLIAQIDGALIGRAKLVISPLPYVDRHLAEMGYPDKPFLWVANGAEPPPDPGELQDRVGEPFTFMYLGAHGRANALGDVIRAFDETCSLCPERPLLLRMVGDGPLKQSLISQASQLTASDRIMFEDHIPKSEVLARARESDCLVVNVQDSPLYRFGVSLNKYYMYMSAGRPIIVASSAPNNPIRDCGAGLSVAGGDINSLAHAMAKMANMSLSERRDLARNGRPELAANYTFDILSRRFAAGLEKAMAS